MPCAASLRTRASCATSCGLTMSRMPVQALRGGLQTLAALDTIDLVCAPDIMRPRLHPTEPNRWLPPDPNAVRTMQVAVLEHCVSSGDRFAILDSLPCADVDAVLQQRQGLSGANGALYYPWVRGLRRPGVHNVPDCPAMADGFIPPCGHVAGVYACTDQRVGVHKAPANENLEGVSDLEFSLDQRAAGSPESDGCELLARLPWPRPPCLGRANPEHGSSLDLHQRAAAGSDGGALDRAQPGGRGVRAARCPVVGACRQRAHGLSRSPVSARRIARPHHTGSVLRQVRRGDQSARSARRGAARHRDWPCACHA